MVEMGPNTKSRTKPRPRSTTNWQHLSVSESDDGKRWRIIWDTVRRAEDEVRSTAVEKTKSAALDRAHHMLRMGFIVYEIRDPSGAVFFDEPTVRAQFSEGVAT
jgi:hypothetical protein